MKPWHYVGIGVFAGALAGFLIAWQVKPAVAITSSETVSPIHTKAERRSTGTGSRSGLTPSEFSRRWQEADNEEHCKEKREAMLSSLSPAEFPALLAEMDDKAGLSGLDNPGDNQLRQLFNAWYAKAPEAALAWLRALPKAEDRQRLLYEIVVEVAETNLDGAVSMLRRDGTDEEGHIFIPDKILERAVVQGEDKLLEICKLGLKPNGDWPSSCQLSYPEGFDFRRVLDGLAEAQAENGDGRFNMVPSNLISEWAKRNFKDAWAWLQEGNSVIFNGTSDLIREFPPAEAGALLASVFDPAAASDRRYEDANIELYRSPTPEMLEAFLKAAPGERGAHLDGLFDELRRANFGELHALVIERMTPEQRAKALRRNFEDGVDPRTRSDLSRLLQRLGHDEEEIQTLLPRLPDQEDGK